MKIKKALVIPDVQAPFADFFSIQAVEKYMKDHTWDYLIYLGDFLDYFTISRFNEGSPGTIEGRTIMKELEVGKKIFERQIEIVRSKNPKCEVIYLEGNHERRAYDWTARNPHLRGLIEPENALQFEKNKVKYVRSWSESEIFNIGKAYFSHGRYTNQHHAKKMVENFEENIFYGHTHDCNSFNKTSAATGKTKVGQSMGCLCLYPKDVDYTKGAPKNWQQSFGVFHFYGTAGHFNYYLVRLFDSSFVSPEGLFYDC
jgi:predicted phosphodiesterase